ncbi:hypothetical protein C8R44DRAFT_984146 [Mycena epipterygia]|nr:hypothetical protein C8R44DRAFT_984146 [Mycena epipterygia]
MGSYAASILPRWYNSTPSTSLQLMVVPPRPPFSAPSLPAPSSSPRGPPTPPAPSPPPPTPASVPATRRHRLRRLRCLDAQAQRGQDRAQARGNARRTARTKCGVSERERVEQWKGWRAWMGGSEPDWKGTNTFDADPDASYFSPATPNANASYFAPTTPNVKYDSNGSCGSTAFALLPLLPCRSPPPFLACTVTVYTAFPPPRSRSSRPSRASSSPPFLFPSSSSASLPRWPLVCPSCLLPLPSHSTYSSPYSPALLISAVLPPIAGKLRPSSPLLVHTSSFFPSSSPSSRPFPLSALLLLPSSSRSSLLLFRSLLPHPRLFTLAHSSPLVRLSMSSLPVVPPLLLVVLLPPSCPSFSAMRRRRSYPPPSLPVVLPRHALPRPISPRPLLPTSSFLPRPAHAPCARQDRRCPRPRRQGSNASASRSRRFRADAVSGVPAPLRASKDAASERVKMTPRVRGNARAAGRHLCDAGRPGATVPAVGYRRDARWACPFFAAGFPFASLQSPRPTPGAGKNDASERVKMTPHARGNTRAVGRHLCDAGWACHLRPWRPDPDALTSLRPIVARTQFPKSPPHSELVKMTPRAPGMPAPLGAIFAMLDGAVITIQDGEIGRWRRSRLVAFLESCASPARCVREW